MNSPQAGPSSPQAGRDRPVLPPMSVRLRAVAMRRWTEWLPPQPRRAATVVLLREQPSPPGDGPPHLHVYLVRRASSMAAAPDMHVFPGGGIAASDGPPTSPQTLVRAAIRELHEETGMLVTDPSRLVPFARWVTPEVLPHRHDTEFFGLAIVDVEQPRLVGTEAVADMWLTPQEALIRADAGNMAMLPPTSAALEMLRHVPDVQGALAVLQARSEDIRALMPAPKFVDDQLEWYLADALTDGQPVTPAEVGLPVDWRPSVPVVSAQQPPKATSERDSPRTEAQQV